MAYGVKACSCHPLMIQAYTETYSAINLFSASVIPFPNDKYYINKEGNSKFFILQRLSPKHATHMVWCNCPSLSIGYSQEKGLLV